MFPRKIILLRRDFPTAFLNLGVKMWQNLDSRVLLEAFAPVTATGDVLTDPSIPNS